MALATVTAIPVTQHLGQQRRRLLFLWIDLLDSSTAKLLDVRGEDGYKVTTTRRVSLLWW